MDPNQASRTALVTSLMRALHTRADPAPIIDDPWGDQLVPEAARDALHQRALADPGARAAAPAGASGRDLIDAFLKTNAAYCSVIVRTRFTEDALHAAVRAGASQYVLVGAGFDSYALRIPAFAPSLRVFEVDHPATQSLKLARLRETGATLPERLHFVAADLAAEPLEVPLRRSAFDPGAKTVFSWLGVSMYLSREDNLAALRSIAGCGPPGSELVFTYIDQAFFDTRPDELDGAMAQLTQLVKSLGEPFLSGFRPEELRRELAGVGLELLEDMAEYDLVERYDPANVNGFRRHSGVGRIARARVD